MIFDIFRPESPNLRSLSALQYPIQPNCRSCLPCIFHRGCESLRCRCDRRKFDLIANVAETDFEERTARKVELIDRGDALYICTSTRQDSQKPCDGNHSDDFCQHSYVIAGDKTSSPSFRRCLRLRCHSTEAYRTYLGTPAMITKPSQQHNSKERLSLGPSDV